MKKMKYLMACSAAIAAGIACADESLTDFDKLVLDTAKTFSADKSGATNATLVPVSPTIEGDYITIDGELVGDEEGNPALSLTASGDAADIKAVEKFDITFKAGFVDAEELPETYANAQIGFALTGGQSAKYYNGTRWCDFNQFAAVAEDEDVTLHVDYDHRQKKARFNLGNVVLTAGDPATTWVPVGTVGSNKIAAYGAGSIKSLVGNAYPIKAEQIKVPDSTVEVVINELDVPELKKAGYAAENTVISGMNNLEAYILTGKVGEKVEAPVAKIAADSADGKVQFNLAGVNVEEVASRISGNTGAVQYVLEGSKDNSSWVTITADVSNTDGTPAITMPLTNADTYKYFRVRAVVVPANNAQ